MEIYSKLHGQMIELSNMESGTCTWMEASSMKTSQKPLSSHGTTFVFIEFGSGLELGSGAASRRQGNRCDLRKAWTCANQVRQEPCTRCLR